MAVVDGRGLGAEIDFSYGGDFDTASFADSSITTLMLSFVALYPDERFRPFLVAGVGIMRAHVGFADGQSSISQIDSAWNLGGGAHLNLNEALGFRGDVRYFRHFSRQSEIPIADGVLDFVRYSVGVTFSWPVR